jgi:hypothetical protein
VPDRLSTAAPDTRSSSEIAVRRYGSSGLRRLPYRAVDPCSHVQERRCYMASGGGRQRNCGDVLLVGLDTEPDRPFK